MSELKDRVERFNQSKFTEEAMERGLFWIVSLIKDQQARIDELESSNERLERKKDDYPNVLAKVFNDLEALRENAANREKQMQARIDELEGKAMIEKITNVLASLDGKIIQIKEGVVTIKCGEFTVQCPLFSEVNTPTEDR